MSINGVEARYFTTRPDTPEFKLNSPVSTMQIKTSKRVNICDFSFEPSVPSAKNPSFLELQETLLRVNYSKLPADLLEQLDRSIPTREFRVFKYLPVEVQRKIFKFNEPGPRVVELRYSNKIAHAASPTPVPAVMRICRESRLEARKRYVLLFKEHWTIPRVWINPEVDTLYLGYEGKYGYGNVGRPYDYTGNHLYINDLASYFHTMLSSLEPPVWSDLKRLGINEMTYSDHARHLFYFNKSSPHPKTSADLGILTRFKQLQRIAIVQDPKTFNPQPGPVTLVGSTKRSCKACAWSTLEHRTTRKFHERCTACLQRIATLDRVGMEWEVRPMYDDKLKQDLNRLLHKKWKPRWEFMVATRLDLEKLGLR